jgi:hypothetical protein
MPSFVLFSLNHDISFCYEEIHYDDEKDMNAYIEYQMYNEHKYEDKEKKQPTPKDGKSNKRRN